LGVDVLSDRLEKDWRTRVEVWVSDEPKSLGGWVRLLGKHRSTVVVFCYGWIFSFPWQAVFAASLLGMHRRLAIQHLVLPALPPPYPGGGLYGVLRRSAGERARRILGWRFAAYLCSSTICVSDAVRKSLLETLKFSPRKTITIHNGVSTAAFFPDGSRAHAVRTRLGIAPEDFVLVCTARLSKVKGIEVLLEALSLVKRRGIACKCIFVGDGPLKQKFLGEAEALGLSDRVFFQGFQKDVQSYLQAGSAFILTSHAEGLPLSVLEAMACGLPCIVTDVGGSAEAVHDRVNGVVIPPGSAEEAAHAIGYLAAHRTECAAMGSRSRELARTQFDIDRQMLEIVNLILD
jgi:glycosyltransferase involved in cell wall biosynthesis